MMEAAAAAATAAKQKRNIANKQNGNTKQGVGGIAIKIQKALCRNCT